MGPYGETAWTYRAAGWAGVLPLPPGAKWPPPAGFTGWAGIEPSGADVQAWVDGPQGAGNIALRLPGGVYGLDVDDYGGKTGGGALAAAVERLGPLPATWIVSSRDDGVSGIRLFRAQLPPGRRWRDEPAGHGAGIEAIHLGHRYAVAWPSVHPDTGRKYVWRGADGMVVDGEVPALSELPELPAAWIGALSEPGEIRVGEMAGHDEAVETVSGWRDGDPCPRVRDAHARALAGLRAAAAGSALHPVSVAGVHELVNLGHEGHAGCRRALAEHYALHVEVRAGRGEGREAAEREWWREVRGAIGKLPGAAVARCDCDLWSGEGLLFDPTEPIAGDAPGGGETAPTQPVVGAVDLVGALRARLLSPAQVRELEPPPPVVDGLLTLDSESWLIAKPGSFKTFVALDLAGHVGTGREWMGRAVRAGPVLYLAAEGAAGMGKRVRAWEQRNGPMADVHFLPVPVQAARPDHWAALVELAREIRPVLTILDTQARITVGLDENDNSQMNRFVESIGQLRRSCGACVLVVHHLGRSGRDARGASAIDGAQDSELKLTRTADRRVVLVTDKQRHLADDVRIDLELFVCELDGGGTSLVVGPALSAAVSAPWDVEPDAHKAKILQVLHEQFSEHGATGAQVLSVLTERGWTADYPKSTFYRWWNDLQRLDKIERVHGTQRWVVPERPVEES